MALLPFSGAADVVVMHSGERFSGSTVWEEGNTIRFDLNGLIVRVDKSEVARIIRSDKPAANAGAPTDELSPASTNPPANEDSLSQASTRMDDNARADEIIPQPRRQAPAKEIIPVVNGAAQQKPEAEALPAITPRTASETPVPPPTAPGYKQFPTPDRPFADQLHEAVPLPEPAPAVPRETGIIGTGFAGIRWGMQPVDLPGIVHTSTEDAYGGIDQYQSTETDPRFGRAPLDAMVLGFWRNRLYTVSCWIAGRPGYERLKAEVFGTYGAGRKNRAGLERFIWQDRTSDRLLEFDSLLNTGIFWMRSRELDRLIRQADLQ
jgi:hypothetical protein